MNNWVFNMMLKKTKLRPNLFAFMNSYTQGISGGDKVFIELAKRIKGFNLIIITSLLGKELCSSEVNAKYLITTNERRFKNIILIYLKRIFKALFLRINTEKDDILYATSDFLPDVIPILFIKLRNVQTKWIQSIFHLIPKNRIVSFFNQRISLLVIKVFADMVIVDNNMLKNDLIRINYKANKIFVHYPGIDLDYLKRISLSDEDEYDGVFMGRLKKSKGILDLISIWKLVVQKKPDVKLAVIGVGNVNVVNKLRLKISKLNLSNNIELLGYLDDIEAFSIIKSSKIFIFPSHEEGFGIAPLEAQGCGLPVIAWNLDVFSEVFKQGMVKVSIGELKTFSEKILELLQNKQKCNDLAKQALMNSSNYDWKVVTMKKIKSIEKIYGY